jgi:ketosteroid isomerase-like protein
MRIVSAIGRCMPSILLLLLLMVSSGAAQEPDSISALFDMREAERSFARASVMRGRNAAFVDHLADESIIFTNTWVANGRQVWKDRRTLPIVLKWEPEFMDIAESRDFGISTGPWEAQEYRPYTSPAATGYFLSVWKRGSGGVWQVILDAGSTTPGRSGYDHHFSFPAGADKAAPPAKNVDIESTKTELSDREEQFLAAWKSNPLPATYASFLAPHARMQRNGHLPTTNADTINVWIVQLHKNLKWSTMGSGAANSGDLGFTYGLLEVRDNPKGSTGHYVRIWKKQPHGRWDIVLEMLNMDDR